MTILVQIETEASTEEVYNGPSEPPNYHHLRKLLSSETYNSSHIVCGNDDFII